VVGYLGEAMVDKIHLWAAAFGAVFVLALGWGIRRMKGQQPLDAPLVVDSPGPDDFPRQAKH
jgi:hypothetical protein